MHHFYWYKDKYKLRGGKFILEEVCSEKNCERREPSIFLQKETICNNINMLSKHRQAKLHAKVNAKLHLAA